MRGVICVSVAVDTRILDNPKVLKYLLPPVDMDEVMKKGNILMNTLCNNEHGVKVCENDFLEYRLAKFKVHTDKAFVIIRTKCIGTNLDTRILIIDDVKSNADFIKRVWDATGHLPGIMSVRKKSGVFCIDTIDEKGTMCHIVVRSFDVATAVKHRKKRGVETNRQIELQKLCDRYRRNLNDIEAISMLTSAFTKAEL